MAYSFQKFEYPLCLVCLKNLVTIVSGKKVTSRRCDLNSYKSHLSKLNELFPEIVCQSRKIFICEQCFNKFQKYLRAQGKLNSAKAEFEHEKMLLFLSIVHIQ